MRYLKTCEAAKLLNISNGMLRSWEQRFGFPTPRRSGGMHRMYVHAEVAALRDALHDGLSITSAVSRARVELATDRNSLVGALLSYSRDQADAAIEGTLKLRSIDSSVEEVLLPALEAIAGRCTLESAAWAFAARWGADWLRRAQLLVSPPERRVSIVLGDASRDELDPDFAYIRAFELFCVRSGAKVMSLSARGASGIGDAIAVHRPDVVVLAGGQLADTAVARWTHLVRLVAGPMPIMVYRRGAQRMRMHTAGMLQLPPGASDAQRCLVGLVDAEHAVRSDPELPAAAYSAGHNPVR